MYRHFFSLVEHVQLQIEILSGSEILMSYTSFNLKIRSFV